MSIKSWLADVLVKFLGPEAVESVIKRYMTEEWADKMEAKKAELEREAAEQVLDFVEDFCDERENMKFLLPLVARFRAIFDLPEIAD